MVSISSFCLMRDLFSWSESSFPLPQSLGKLQNYLSLYFASSPQVAGVPRFRFGPPEDMPQTSSSHSDLGQLASQGGKAFSFPWVFECKRENSVNKLLKCGNLQLLNNCQPREKNRK